MMFTIMTVKGNADVHVLWQCFSFTLLCAELSLSEDWSVLTFNTTTHTHSLSIDSRC